MSEHEDDGPTLPLIPGGVSLRDWFAGQALAGLLANHPQTPLLDEEDRNQVALWAYLLAAEMINVRSRL